ncbi:MAG: hypothetical protein HY868_17420 [Chloroflexi bacterium]|nr:hypothetical protein [Chloroflexota bacterium]
MRKSSKPVVRHDRVVTDEPGTLNPIRVGSPQWFAWLDQTPGFVFEGGAGYFTARRETRRGIAYWYAYRWRAGKLAKTYLGKSEELTQECFEQASARLAGQTTLARLASQSDSVDLTTPLIQVADTSPPQATTSELSFLPLTKIKPPTLPQDLVARPRLTQQLTAPVTIIYAPSGFGKSTLLNEWRQTCAMPVAWVSLDADDNSPSRFWSTVLLSLRTNYPNLGHALLSQLQMSSASASSEIVVALSNEIVRVMDEENPPRGMALILDDYHHVQQPVIHASLQTLIEHLPPALRLIISSHTKPPIVLGRLRAKGIVTELKTEDLRFTVEEGIDFLWRRNPNRRLAFGDMQTLVKRTEGWVAGLTLATLALTQYNDRQAFMANFSGAHAYLHEYFMESILHQQSPAVQTFLLRTAVLKHLTGGLCDAVTGQNDGAEMLARLWQENLFLVRLEEQDWYRYHDLFAEMLCSQLQAQFPGEIRQLHQRAAEWYRTQNAPAEAVHHFLAIGEWEQAAALIESVALRELEQFGEDSRLLQWLQQLPETVMQHHKTLLAVFVRLAKMALSQTEVERFLAHTETSIARKPLAEQTRDEQAVLLEIQRLKRAWATGASAELPTNGEHAEVWQMLNELARFRLNMRQQLDQAEAIAQEVYEAAQARRHLFVMLMAGGTCACIAASRGNLRRSEKIAHQVLQQALARRGKLPEPASIALTTMSRVCYERNQLAHAHQLLLRATEVDPNPTSSNMRVMVAVTRALIQSAEGNHDAAQVTIQAALELNTQRPSGAWLNQDLIAYQALFVLRQGDGASAERLLNEAGEATTHAFSRRVQAEILLEHDAAGAEEILNALLAEYPHGLYREPLMGTRILCALALFKQNKPNQARQAMTDALRLASPEGFLRPFLDYGSQVASLLTLVLHTGNLTGETQMFAKQLVRLLGSANGGYTPLPKHELAALSTAASISAREQEVLRLVSAGLSNQEIADCFCISTCTVKTHLENIYRKLGVNSRTQAIAQAQTLRLV